MSNRKSCTIDRVVHELMVDRKRLAKLGVLDSFIKRTGSICLSNTASCYSIPLGRKKAMRSSLWTRLTTQTCLRICTLRKRSGQARRDAHLIFKKSMPLEAHKDRNIMARHPALPNCVRGSCFCCGFVDQERKQQVRIQHAQIFNKRF